MIQSAETMKAAFGIEPLLTKDGDEVGEKGSDSFGHGQRRYTRHSKNIVGLMLRTMVLRCMIWARMLMPGNQYQRQRKQRHRANRAFCPHDDNNA